MVRKPGPHGQGRRGLPSHRDRRPGLTAGTALFSIIYLPFPAPELPEPKPNVESRITHILDANGQEIGVLRRFDTSIPVKQSDIPDITKAAIVAAEDKRFYSHNGFDLIGAMRAAWADFRGREVVQGGSTITQQYIKKVYVGDERTLSRKIREAVLAGQLDRKVDKDEILYRYMSTVYYGGGAYGIGAAAESYFKKPVNDLNVSESAMLAGLLSAPSELDPRTNPKQAEANRLGVLDAMLDQKRISSVQHAQAVDQKIFLVGSTEAPPPPNATLIHPVELQSTTQPYFVDYVVRYLVAKYGDDIVYRGGLKVETTLDPKLQTLAEDIGEERAGQAPPRRWRWRWCRWSRGRATSRRWWAAGTSPSRRSTWPWAPARPPTASPTPPTGPSAWPAAAPAASLARRSRSSPWPRPSRRASGRGGCTPGPAPTRSPAAAAPSAR